MIGETIAKNLIERFNPKSVLFCPYKEEMWDSMQTIYETFKNKFPEIETDIMPMAYYELANKRITNMKIEFPSYKENFPLRLCREAREDEVYNGWDIIFFHYPYDNLNTLTRPLLYSNELKAFCRHLVLVGYACVGERLPFAQEMSYSGVRNSDLVIVETEEQAAEGNKLLKGQPNWHGEVVGWGSAKYDMVDLANIPDEWKEKAEGRRKVFLQTSIVPYMRNKNKIEQIENIIDNYLKNPKVCLIWRPHPLYRTTIISQGRHELYRYSLLVKKIQNSPKDIFDDTKTPENAIKFADEMISDPSSLVHLWKTTGKKLTEI